MARQFSGFLPTFEIDGMAENSFGHALQKATISGPMPRHARAIFKEGTIASHISSVAGSASHDALTPRRHALGPAAEVRAPRPKAFTPAVISDRAGRPSAPSPHEATRRCHYAGIITRAPRRAFATATIYDRPKAALLLPCWLSTIITSIMFIRRRAADAAHQAHSSFGMTSVRQPLSAICRANFSIGHAVSMLMALPITAITSARRVD